AKINLHRQTQYNTNEKEGGKKKEIRQWKEEKKGGKENVQKLKLSLEVPPPLMFPMTVMPLGRDQDCSLKNQEPDIRLSWFLDPGGWSKAAVVGLYFIFPGICTLSLATYGMRWFYSHSETPSIGFCCGILFILTIFRIPFFNASLTKELVKNKNKQEDQQVVLEDRPLAST
ncbi:hypothetical protein STEG23_030131, partial [Scotinomys teguina]